MRNYVIKSRRMRIFLQEHGLDCQVRQDYNDPTKDVYLFIDSPILRKLMAHYANKKRK